MTEQTAIENTEMLDKIIDIISSFSPSGEPIQANTQIIKDGVIDSLSVFNIIVNLEKAFNISIGFMDATIDDFHTPDSIAELITKVMKKK